MVEGIGSTADADQAAAQAGRPRIQSGKTQGIPVEGDSANGAAK